MTRSVMMMIFLIVGGLSALNGTLMIIIALRSYLSDRQPSHSLEFLVPVIVGGVGRIGIGTWLIAVPTLGASPVWLLIPSFLVVLGPGLARGLIGRLASRGKPSVP